MSMLAAPRRKQKWTLNPRGKHWSEDSNKFGQKMLEKMGWSSGKGLGAKEQGMVEHIRVRVKNDQVGIGYSKDKDDHWTENQEDFNSFLQNLQKEQFTQSTEEAIEEKDKVLSGKSLEEKSKQSQKRVHYKKFTRGKDVNKYSAKDLANIFGKRDLEEKPQKVEEEDDSKVYDPVGTKDTTAGVVTIKGGNMQEYFSKKFGISESSIKVERNDEISESETENRAGFGFLPKSKSKFYVDDVEKEDSDGEADKYRGFGFLKSSESKHKSKKLNNLDYVFDNPCLDLNILDSSLPSDKNADSNDAVTPKKRKNEELDVESLDKPKSKKQKYSYENEGLDLKFPDNSKVTQEEVVVEESVSKKSKKGKKSKKLSSAYENQSLDSDLSNISEAKENGEVESSELNLQISNGATPKKSKKGKKLEEESNGIENPGLDLNFPDRPTPKKIKDTPSGIVNLGLDLDFPEKPTPKKSKKNKEIEVISCGIENPALDLNFPEKQTLKKSKKNKEIEVTSCGIENPALDLNFPEKSTPKKSKKNKEIEVPSCGIENPALDLNFPDTSTPSKSKRKLEVQVGIENPGLDLECPDRPTPKKKKKSQENGFVNPALDLNYAENEICSALEYEVPSTLGVENGALNLSDENSRKKRVTFNDEIEYSTDSVNKKKKKLDKYEVVNEKAKKKKKSAEPVTFVNEALDVEVINLEEIDNEINEKKSQKCERKRKRRISLLETIEEAPEEENSADVSNDGDVEIVAELPADDITIENSPKKKSKNKKAKKEKERLNETEESEEAIVKIEEIDLTKKETKKKKKKKNRESDCIETIEIDNPGKENVFGEALALEDTDCKKKKKKKKLDEDVISLEEFLNEDNVETVAPEAPKVETHEKIESNNFQRTHSFRKTKDMMRSLFAKNPTLLFNGSNINEIKGYGSSFYTS